MDEFQHVYQIKRITFTLKNDLQVLIPHEDLVWNRQDEETMRTTSHVGFLPPTWDWSLSLPFLDCSRMCSGLLSIGFVSLKLNVADWPCELKWTVLVLWWHDKLVSAGMIHPGFIHIILLIRWSQWYMILNLCCFVQVQICDYELIFFEPAMLNFFSKFFMVENIVHSFCFWIIICFWNWDLETVISLDYWGCINTFNMSWSYYN